MNNLISKLSSGWNLMRIVRTGLGLAAFIEGIRAHDYLIGILGAFLLYQGLTNTGCCSAVGCVVRPPKEETEKIQDISYKEVK